MKTHAFTLTFSVPNTGNSADELAEQLGEAGCTDSLVGLGRAGSVTLIFDRQAESAHEAVSTAIADVKKAIPNARLDEATPDLLDLADLENVGDDNYQSARKKVMMAAAERT